MDTKELLKRIRKIELKTNRLSKEAFSGDYHSAFKGRGMAFSEVKNYQYGDDVRNIDWNVTARFDEPYVKVFEEERELTVILVCDVSKSMDFGSTERTKKELMLEIAATIGFSATRNNDKVGAIFISDVVEDFIPPKKGRSHVLMLLKKLIDHDSSKTETDLNEGLRYFRNVINKRSICFVLSDFFDEGDFMEGLRIASRKHDLLALKLYDQAEMELPDLGLIEMYDSETGRKEWVNTSNKTQCKKYANLFLTKSDELLDQLKKSGIDGANFSTSDDFVYFLTKIFAKRRR
jgi:uncharacterized protein (DUF58 family)